MKKLCNIEEMSKYYCYITGRKIPLKRVRALKKLGVPQEKMTCIEYAQKLGKKRFGAFIGEDIIICDSLGENFCFNKEEKETEENS